MPRNVCVYASRVPYFIIIYGVNLNFTTINIKRFGMKRLITFIALLTCFLGAKAEWVEDYRIDYQDYSGFPFWVMGYVPEWIDGVMTDYGAMYTYKTEAEEGDNVVGSVSTNNGTEYQKILLTEPGWHQYFIATDIPTEIGGSYIVKAKVKASEPCEIRVSLKWGWGDGECIDIPIHIGPDTYEVEWAVNNVGGTSCNIVAQPGISTAIIEWESVSVGHEKKNDNPFELIYGIDYSELTDYPFYRLDAPEGASYDVVDGVLQFENTVQQANFWDIQATIAEGFALQEGNDYVVHLTYKSSAAGSISLVLGTWDEFMLNESVVLEETDDWTTLEVPFDKYSYNFSDAHLLLQCGSFVGTIQVLQVELYERQNAPMVYGEWKNVVNNGDMEGDDTSSFYAKEYPSIDIVNATIVDGVGVDDSRCIQAYAPAKVEEDWDSQFWIRSNVALPEGTKYRISFDCRSDIPATVHTESHSKDMGYVFWKAIGDIYFSDEWQTIIFEGVVSQDMSPEDNFQSLCFSLTGEKDNNFYFDNIVFEVSLLEPLAVEDATLYVGEDVAMLKGETNILPIKMTSREEITGLQFDLELPNGFDLSRVALSGYNSETHSVSRNVLDDGSIRFIVVSQENEILSDTEDGLLNLSIYVDENLAIGQLPVTLKNAQFTTTDYKTLNSTDKTFIVNVKDAFMMGDVNGDGYVNVTDVVLIIDQILEKNPKNFNAAAADVNFDGYINVTDVVLVIDAILGKTDLNRAAAMENVNDMAAVVEMPAQLNLAGDVAVSLTNPTAYTAFQMDVTLPMGVSLEKAQLTARGTDSHQVSVSQTGEGRYRIVGFSTENEPLNGHSGDLLNVSLQSNGQTSGTLAINNVIFVTPEGTQHLLNGIESFGGTTGIADVSGKKSDVSGDIYDLQGRSVNGKTSKNVYIINGNKYFTK